MIAVLCGDTMPTPSDLCAILTLIDTHNVTELRHPDTRPCSRRVAAEVSQQRPSITLRAFAPQWRTFDGFDPNAESQRNAALLQGADVVLWLCAGTKPTADTADLLAKAREAGVPIHVLHTAQGNP